MVIGEEEYVLTPLTDSVGFLARVADLQLRERIRAAGGLALSPAILSLLKLVRANPGIRQAHAARILLIQESNMANLIKALIGEGLIRRGVADGSQNKRAGLWLTELGEKELRHDVEAAKIDRQYAAILTNAQYASLLSLLGRIYRASI